MSTSRRALTLIGLTVAALIGAIAPASATFSETVKVTTPVGTATITPPTQLEAKSICTTTVDPLTQASTSTVTDVKVEWQESTFLRATGYRITVHPAGGPAYTLATIGRTDEIFVDPSDVRGNNPRISVTTLSGTTWTAQSVLTGITSC
ncbi:hypothetical protein [Blastococcus sp. CT_GayMR19]|uniref:hypothetical protein n=1 Tax=Blastococcus sp. CT_GayMR19 TaxID=2559608 RepID=UPI0014302F93|nr:hypothetical protein [Blastococcus sp. CT_GayMR19]